MSEEVDATTCPCYGCSIERQRAGIPAPDRSGEPCEPIGACASDKECMRQADRLNKETP